MSISISRRLSMVIGPACLECSLSWLPFHQHGIGNVNMIGEDFFGMMLNETTIALTRRCENEPWIEIGSDVDPSAARGYRDNLT